MMTHDHEAFIHQIRLFSGLTGQELKSIEKGRRYGLKQEIKYLLKENMILFMHY